MFAAEKSGDEEVFLQKRADDSVCVSLKHLHRWKREEAALTIPRFAGYPRNADVEVHKDLATKHDARCRCRLPLPSHWHDSRYEGCLPHNTDRRSMKTLGLVCRPRDRVFRGALRRANRAPGVILPSNIHPIPQHLLARGLSRKEADSVGIHVGPHGLVVIAGTPRTLQRRCLNLSYELERALASSRSG